MYLSCAQEAPKPDSMSIGSAHPETAARSGAQAEAGMEPGPEAATGHAGYASGGREVLAGAPHDGMGDAAAEVEDPSSVKEPPQPVMHPARPLPHLPLMREV